jgi:hypothetical protein
MSDDAETRIAELERSLRELLRTRPADDPQLALTRNNLAIQYRNRGDVGQSAALYAEVRVCEHLEPLRQSLLAGGAAITFAGQPWSHNCHTWIYFDSVVDPLALRQRFPLADCVIDHRHRGTHEGSEQGLVCSMHHDALVGPHPDA